MSTRIRPIETFSRGLGDTEETLFVAISDEVNDSRTLRVVESVIGGQVEERSYAYDIHLWTPAGWTFVVTLGGSEVEDINHAALVAFRILTAWA